MNTIFPALEEPPTTLSTSSKFIMNRSIIKNLPVLEDTLTTLSTSCTPKNLRNKTHPNLEDTLSPTLSTHQSSITTTLTKSTNHMLS
jgi:hypothetical protein